MDHGEEARGPVRRPALERGPEGEHVRMHVVSGSAAAAAAAATAAATATAARGVKCGACSSVSKGRGLRKGTAWVRQERSSARSRTAAASRESRFSICPTFACTHASSASTYAFLTGALRAARASVTAAVSKQHHVGTGFAERPLVRQVTQRARVHAPRVPQQNKTRRLLESESHVCTALAQRRPFCLAISGKWMLGWLG